MAWRDVDGAGTNLANAVHVREGVRVLKLPYMGGISNFGILQDDSLLPTGFDSDTNIRTVSFQRDSPLYNNTLPTRGQLFELGGPHEISPLDIVLIHETGEIILGEDIALWMQEDNALSVKYVREGFSAGDLNPRIYFNSFQFPPLTFPIEVSPVEELEDMDDLLAMFAELRTLDPNTLADMARIREINAFLVELDINHFFNDIGNINDQRLRFEFSFNTRVPINTLARDVITASLYADLSDLARFIKSMDGMLSDTQMLREHFGALYPNETNEQISTRVEERRSTERSALNLAAASRFNTMLGRIDDHFKKISRQDSDMGSRMQRLDIIRDRLVEDVTNFRQLISDNEGVDFIQQSMLINMAQAVYDSSLMVGANILQMTLADFIR
jgi:hypothetical protein